MLKISSSNISAQFVLTFPLFVKMEEKSSSGYLALKPVSPVLDVKWWGIMKTRPCCIIVSIASLNVSSALSDGLNCKTR